MNRHGEKVFLEEAKKAMNENIHLLRFADTIKNVEKLKFKHIELSEENTHLTMENIRLSGFVELLSENNQSLYEHISFLEEIINSMHIMVSLKDLNRRNLLYYNQNYNRLLGYKHKELQELQTEEAESFYHPDDRIALEERKNYFKNAEINRHKCAFRMKHKNGKWVQMNSDLIVLKRNPDGSLSTALEILSNVV